MMDRARGGRAAIVLVLAGGLGLGALAYYVRTTPEAGRVPDAIRRDPTVAPTTKTPPPDEPPKPVEKKTLAPETTTVRLPVFGDSIADMELAKAETPVPDGASAMRFVAGRIAEAAHLDGARVLGVEVREHTAFVSYNAAVQKGMGSMEEGAFLRALQIGFGQFTGVDRVAVESDGRPLESGHVDLAEPLAVIRPGERAASDPTPVEP